MARRIAYTGAAVITLADVAQQCRAEVEDLQSQLIEHVIIPGVTAQAEERTGAAIRAAEYEEDWPASYSSGHALDVGQAGEIVSIERVLPSGALEDVTAARYLQRLQRESFLHFPDGRPAGLLRIRYKAGYEPAAYPAVKLWLLMNAATAYEYRETLITGTILAQLPSAFLDSMLSEITVPPRF